MRGLRKGKGGQKTAPGGAGAAVRKRIRIGDRREASGEDESGNISTTTRLTNPRIISVPIRTGDEQRKFGQNVAHRNASKSLPSTAAATLSCRISSVPS